ncbi:MAG: hypothetical protein GX802_04755 [Clostridiales bacterium]|jgi:hypothetical protein|nr:hypothetical protein [Clostridiales bacterium]
MIKKFHIKRIAFVCALVFIATCVATACNVVPEGALPSATPAQYTEEELNTPVITVGEYKVTFGEYLSFFNNIAAYYRQNYNLDITEKPEDLAKYKEKITETLAQEKMLLYRANELGLTDLTAEQLTEIDERYEQDVEELYEYYTELAEKDKESDDTLDVDKQVEKYILNEAKYNLGEDATIESYMDYMKESAHDGYIVDLLIAEITKGVTVSQKDIADWYADSKADDVKYYTENPGEYKTEREMFDMYGTISDHKTAVPPLLVPEGYSRVLHIFTTAEGEYSKEYKDNQTKMSALEKEYGELALADSLSGKKTNETRLKEIVTEYKKLSDENTKEHNALFKDAKAKINEAYTKLQAGEDFGVVMLKYSEDGAIINYESMQKDGLLISTEHKAKEDWSAMAKSEFAKLKKGEYSKVFKDDDGYHIIYYLGDEKAGEIALKDISDTIMKHLLPTLKDEHYNAKVEEWMKDNEKIMVINNELIEKVGVK